MEKKKKLEKLSRKKKKKKHKHISDRARSEERSMAQFMKPHHMDGNYSQGEVWSNTIVLNKVFFNAALILLPSEH